MSQEGHGCPAVARGPLSASSLLGADMDFAGAATLICIASLEHRNALNRDEATITSVYPPKAHTPCKPCVSPYAVENQIVAS